MNNYPDNRQADKRARQRIKLPFEKKGGDAGEWSYDHRAGICITLIAYLLFAIIFVAGKIDLSPDKGHGNILIELPEEKKPELSPEQIRLLETMAMDDYYSGVSNRISNENAELNAALKDDRGTKASDLYDDAGALDEQMRANRQAYEAGLAKINAMGDSGSDKLNENNEKVQNAKIKGRVTVSFEFNNPVRNSVKLIVPAYKCEGGGEVTVIAILDHNGYVISASVDQRVSFSDDCMQTTALKAARGSRFNLDTSAPIKHQGIITYMFVPQ